VVGNNSPTQTLTLSNTGNATLTGIGVVVTAPFNRLGGSCGTTLNAGATCSITVRFSPTAAGAANGAVTITANVPVTGSPGALTGTGTAPVAIHVGDLDWSRNVGGNSWTATVTITVHDANHNLVSGASVNGSWNVATGNGSNGNNAGIPCTTNASGQCSVSRTGMGNGRASATFTVSGVTLSGDIYQAGSNHDPDVGVQASNGTTITVSRQ
jgi:hypothetical protein